MVFQVEITAPALSDAETYTEYIRKVKQEPIAAERWFRGLVKAIHSLEHFPERCPILPEYAGFPVDLRHLIHYSHRIIFSVEKASRTVLIYRIYHSSREPLERIK